MSSVGTVPPYLFTQEGTFDAPFDFEVPASLEVQPYTAHAVFDGTGASGAFRPCLTFYSASGVVLGRYFPAEVMQAGDVAEVTYTPPFGTAPVSPSASAKITISIYSVDPAAKVTPNTVTRCEWALFQGPPLFDLSTPTFPAALQSGVYRYWAWPFVQDDGTALTAGASAFAELDGGESQNFALTSWPLLAYFGGKIPSFLGTECYSDATTAEGPSFEVDHNNALSLEMGSQIMVAFTPQAAP